MVLLVLLVFSGAVVAQDLTFAGSWGTTKKWARNKIYFDHSVTFYCGCNYAERGESGDTITQASCGYDGSNDGYPHRASVLEWEHVVPASLMPARAMTCWTTGLPQCDEPGRDCCESHDRVARSMIFDLNNLVPSIGQVNALRSDTRYGLIPEEERELGACDFEWNTQVSEPPMVQRGEVARIWLYMYQRHGVQLQSGELSMFRLWSCEDKPESGGWEITRNERIKASQGNGNPFVDEPCS